MCSHFSVSGKYILESCVEHFFEAFINHTKQAALIKQNNSDLRTLLSGRHYTVQTRSALNN